MSKALYIAEKPSVAREFARALHIQGVQRDGFMESRDAIVTWCVGHLVTMSYPEVYDARYKRWSLDTLPFLPETFLYEVIPSVKKQFQIVSGLLNRKDVEVIYVCTDSGREGEYIYRLVEQMAQVKGKKRLRVWIDSQTEEEILHGIREAKDLSEYDHLADSAYLRAKEDYLMGINFSRLLTLKYGQSVSNYMGSGHTVIAVGRVMTCVLGMIVRREREIRQFVKMPFYRVLASMDLGGSNLSGEFRAVEGSAWYGSPKLYKENGFRDRADAQRLIDALQVEKPVQALVVKLERKKENKYPPLLYNLAELQNDCSKRFKISPDQTLGIAQELYEKKLLTYPRTDARVLSSAAAKEIHKNISGLQNFQPLASFAQEVLAGESWKKLGSTRYVNDKQITDHYAIVPTGQGFGALRGLKPLAAQVYELVARRFLSIFYPPAVYHKINLVTSIQKEQFFSGCRVLLSEGYLKVAGRLPESGKEDAGEEPGCDAGLLEALKKCKKGDLLAVTGFEIKQGETSPPKRYTSGSMILAMENAGQLIEDEELRAQIRGSGIGTSATRAEILKKLAANAYISLNKKTQVLSPTLLGEMIYEVVYGSIRSLLNPELTASWEKGLTYVAEGTITPEEYMKKLEDFVRRRTEYVLHESGQSVLRARFDEAAAFYADAGRQKSGRARKTGASRSKK